MPLEPEDQRHLTSAEGYVELGMYLEANEELENIDPDVRHVPEVLAVRLQIYQALKKWELMQTVASKLAKYDPDEPQWAISWAYATRRARSIEIAKDILLHALERHSEEAMIHYNLACYECQLGNLEVAKVRLERATKLYKGCRQLALDDEGLEAAVELVCWGAWIELSVLNRPAVPSILVTDTRTGQEKGCIDLVPNRNVAKAELEHLPKRWLP